MDGYDGMIMAAAQRIRAAVAPKPVRLASRTVITSSNIGTPLGEKVENSER